MVCVNIYWDLASKVNNMVKQNSNSLIGEKDYREKHNAWFDD